MEQYGTFVYFGVIIAVFYFLIIRPQQKRQKAVRELVESLEVGDRVVTAGGLHGSIRSVSEDDVDIEIADGIIVTVSKGAISKKAEE